MPPIVRKLFDPTTLQSVINVLSIESWLEETIDWKKRRYEEATPSKVLVMQATSSQPQSQKMKKQKAIATLATDPSISHMLMQITEPQKEGEFDELTANDFQIRTIDIGVLEHDFILNIWKSTNERIEGKLEELRAEKEVRKASNKELMNCIRTALGSTSTSTFNSNAEENKNFLLKLQQERKFDQIGRSWINQMKAQGPPLIRNLENLLLDANKLREAVSSHQATMQTSLNRLIE